MTWKDLRERAAAPPVPSPHDGAWADASGSGEALLIEGGRVGWLARGTPGFYRATWGPAEVALERWARVTRFAVEAAGDERLVLTSPSGARHVFTRAEAVPEALLVPPWEVAEPRPLDPARIAALQAELAERVERDQRVRSEEPPPPESAAVDRENTARIIELLAEVGWIDAERFGSRAEHDAWLLVQHSGDPRLMKAVLPRVKETDPRGYALLHDRLQLSLGHRQRYGSQLGVDESGRLVLMPLEDPSRVEVRRREVGLGWLAEYLALFAGSTGGRPVRMPDRP